MVFKKKLVISWVVFALLILAIIAGLMWVGNLVYIPVA